MLDGDRLGESIAQAIVASRPSATEKITDDQLTDMWKIIGNAIVTEITANAIVNSQGTATVAGGSSSGSHPSVSVGSIT